MTAAARARALELLIHEIRRAFHRLRITAEHLHGDEEISAGERAVLFELDRQGPRTVPEMARARPVSRQHIQSLVNPLLRDGQVELVDNPAHRRSKKVRLTPTGRSSVRRMRRREEAILTALPVRSTRKEVLAAAAVLRELREVLEGEAWERLAREGRNP
jgi:DNA-binding MarR family transcriptional regulator